MILLNSSLDAASLPPFEPDPPPRQDTKRMMRRIIWGVPIVVVGTLLGALGGVFLLHKIPSTYTSSVSILIDPKAPGAYGASSDFGNSFVDSSKIANVEEILLSSAVLDRVIAKEHLADDPQFGDPSHSVLAQWFPWLGTEPSSGTKDSAALRKDRAVERLGRLIKTARVGVTYVVDVDVAGSTAEGAQRMAQDIADAYLAEQLDAKLDAVQSDSEWLTNRLKEQHAAWTRSDAAVEALRQKLGVTGSDAASDTTVDRDSITELNRDLVAAEAELATAKARYDQANQVMKTGGGLDGLSAVTGSPVIASLRAQQAQASERLANLAQRYGADHPIRQQAQHDLGALNTQVQLEVSRIVAALRNDYQIALRHRDALKAQLAGRVGTVNATASAEGRIELRDAEGVAESNKVAYYATLSKLKDVEQQQTRQDVEARIISGPDLPERPSFPKPILVIPAAAMLGLILSAGLALVLPMRRSRVEDALDAERDLALPVLATVPYMTSAVLEQAGAARSIPKYLMVNPFSLFGESLRILRLRLSKKGPLGNQVIQITSSVQGEGKSTVAASLAISAASAGIKTVLVDLDLYHPESGRLLEFDDSQGVVDVLKGSVAAAVALRTYKDLPLRVITAGSIKQLHPSMIESTELRDLIDGLREEYDLIILDTPPVLAISDPLFISKLVDATVMVIAWRATPQEMVSEAVRALRNMHAPLAGLLLNKVNYARTGKYSGYYYGDRRYISA